jgi:hypothetical protein
MKRRMLLGLAAVVIMLAVVALASQRAASLLVLEWTSKAPAETVPVAVLIELGLNDTKLAKTHDWSGQASVTGAKVVLREGYRFRPSAGDKLLEGNAWEAKSHIGLRVPPKNPAVSKMEAIATVGVVLHLADFKPDATLTIEPKNADHSKATIKLKDVLAGKSQVLWDGAAVVRLVSTATLVNDAKTEDDFPAAAYGPDGTLWVAYTSYTVRDESRRIEQHKFKQQPDTFKDLYTPEFADQVWLKSYRGGKWTAPMAVTGPKESIARCAVAVESSGDVWVVYSAMRNGRHDLFARVLNDKATGLAPEVRLTSDGLSNLSPVACTGQDGSVVVGFQEWGSKGGHALAISTTRGKFGPAKAWTESGNCWHMALAADSAGRNMMLFDSYAQGDYDINLVDTSKLEPARWPGIIESARFEARPSGVFDTKDRLWIAFEEGPERWGKDYGALNNRDGQPLYDARSIKVICQGTDGKLYQPVAELPTIKVEHPVLPFEAEKTHKYESSTKYAYPKIGIDGKGHIWLTYRHSFGSRYTTHPGSYWVTFARRLEGDKWSEPIELHHSDGLLDSRPVLLPHNSGGLLVIHNTDCRYTEPEIIHNKIYKSVIKLQGEPGEPKLVELKKEQRTAADIARAKKEQDAVAAIKKYRAVAGGKKYQFLRGEFHRHTEISWDGGADGSLEDMFRYAIDAASLDWIGNGDHDNGAGREYSWWLIQKFSDAYHVPDYFTPMFTYERSVAYPHGHRNCMFAQRGVRTLPRLAPAANEKGVAGESPNDTKMLYRYLKEMGGLCASHTSATGMGTDWRDNDPAVEPIVEIYQGDRMSYEKEGAPRAGYSPESKMLPTNVGGWKSDGFVNLALQKGYKLGFQASSDHWSTHISFFVILSEKRDRESMLAAVLKRHCYGATDNIILNLRSGEHLMGDEFKTGAAPKLDIEVIGTSKIAKIDILRDSEVVDTLKPDTDRYTGSWTDPNPVAGVHYYYIRVLQADDEIAWASPMWIEMTK